MWELILACARPHNRHHKPKALDCNGRSTLLLQRKAKGKEGSCPKELLYHTASDVIGLTHGLREPLLVRHVSAASHVKHLVRRVHQGPRREVGTNASLVRDWQTTHRVPRGRARDLKYREPLLWNPTLWVFPPTFFFRLCHSATDS